MKWSTVWLLGVWVAASTAGMTAARAFAQDRPSAPVIRVNAAELQIGGRVQTQFNTTTADGQPDGEILLRRVRLEATLRVNRVVSGRVQPDFAGDRVSVKDAYLKLDFAPAVQLLAGKAYRPFSLLEQTSSTRILPIERGVMIRGVDALDEYALVNQLGYSDRDIGFQVMGSPSGAPLGLSYAAGVFAGPLHRRTGDEDTYQYAARATIRPLSGLTLGGAWSSRAFADSLGGGRFELERGDAFEVDAEIGSFAPGWHLMSELTFGEYDPARGTDFRAAQAWLAYRTRPLGEQVSAVEPIFRASVSEIDGGHPGGGTLLTPGINVYFGGLNRMMFNYDFWSPSGEGEAEGSFKAQFQLAF